MNTEMNETNPAPEFDEPRMSRFTQLKIVCLTVLVMLFAFFLWMNFNPTEVWLFGWTVSIPLIVVAIGSFVIGAISGIIGYMLYCRRLEEE